MKAYRSLYGVWIKVLLTTFVTTVHAIEPGRFLCSGTLPIMFINSEEPITSKDYYVKATCYIDALGQEGYESLGTIDAPIPLQIKGRGNWTWRAFEKKPYRLKFDDKVKPLGMKPNRHFTLLAHADDDLTFLRNTCGFELSRLIGFAYTPAQEPIEVVLNGDYVGLYMLTEKIRVGENRVEITKQADLATDPDEITGGWLLEIDNYVQESGQIKLDSSPEPDFTYHSPEILSKEQEEYITNFLNAADEAIYYSDVAWERYIDMETLARYYIVREIMDDAESFRGSCFMHKERGADTKLKFGPVWDFGNAFQRGHNKFIWQDPPYGAVWIKKIYSFTKFKHCVKDIWQPFIGMHYPKLDKAIDDFIERIRYAVDSNVARWPEAYTGPIDSRKQLMKQCLSEKVEFLTSKWGKGVIVEDGIISPMTKQDNDSCWYTLEGRQLNEEPATPGLYLHGRRKVVIR